MRSHLAVNRFGPRELVLSGVLSLTWGSSFLFIAVAIEHVDPAVVPFGRSLLGAITLVLLPGARAAIPWKHWPRIALLGLVWMALPFWLFPLAEQSVTSGVAGMINGGLPVVIALVTALWVWRMPSVKRIVAIALGFTGIAVIALPAIWAESSTGESIADVRGIVYLLAAVLGYAVGSNLARPLQAQFAPARLLARVQLAAAIWTLPIALPGIGKSTFAWSAVAAIAVLGIVGTGVAFVVFGTLLERTGITRAMIPTYFTPIVGLVLGAAFNGESIASLSIVGMCIVIASAWMTSKPDERDVMLSDATEER
ncbi:MAG: DMT family transporter [Ilumatobacteraceae bacterium]